VYYGGPGGGLLADVTLTGPDRGGDQFGCSVEHTLATSNGDGQADVIVGA
jgi:hypothetical protein